MKFNYIFAYLLSDSVPPCGSTLKNYINKGYRFAPLCHDGYIYTIDFDIWRSVALKEQVVMFRSEIFPEEKGIQDAILIKKQKHTLLLGMCSEEKIFDFANNRYLNLISINAIKSLPSFDKLGFDVVDSTGLSALTNIGYNDSDLLLLNGENIKTNDYGLLADKESANEYSTLSKNHSPEHSPFYVLSILKIR